MSSTLLSSPTQICCKGILFDMDGILISSIGSVIRSWTKWAQMHDLDPASTIRAAHGCRVVETVARLRPDLDPAAELAILEDLEVNDVDGLTTLPGVLNFLSTLPISRWTVVTSATERLARVRLEHAGLPLPLNLVTADSVTKGKPHPDPFLAGAALLGFAPEDCVVFEDAPSGVVAGRAAGCTVIATPFTYTLAELADADYFIQDMTQISAESVENGIALSLNPLMVAS